MSWMHFNSKAITNPSTLLEQCVHDKLKSLSEETVGQVGYS